GGTHAYRTGEVGMIAMRSWERAKGLTRIEFVAGMRALADYRKANRTARDVAALFSTGRDDAPKYAAQMVDENKDLHRQVRVLEEVTAGVEADRLLASAMTQPDGTRVVSHVFDARDAEFLKKIAHVLMTHSKTIALLASRDKDAARLVFARSADAPGDMNALMREACTILDGRGGGKPDMAQGGGKNVEKLELAMETIRSNMTH
ncbi:MAG TPA: DHHA1 domain-containing protein, partial [Pyrinomonadaceae bacterium]|nr:DHHA1 domain-containing protein [Pyrinomonadaceae bacterium]